jgi:hypothetical protein
MDNNIGETKQEQEQEVEEQEVEEQEVEEDGVYNSDSIYNKSPAELEINKEAINQLKMIEIMEKTQVGLNKYFRDKSKYEKKIHDLKNKLRKKDLSNREKRREFKNSVKCIKCGKNGGTLFSNENNVLKEVCNATEPCSLNVEIKRIVIDNLVDLERRYTRRLNDVKKQIVIANMDLLFKYKSPDETIELFEKTLNVSLEKSKEDLRVYTELVSSIVNRNKDAISEKVKILKDEINGLNADNRFGGIEGGGGGISNVDKYITNIIPLLKELRELKYNYSGTECESSLSETPCSDATDNIYMIQTPFTIKTMEVEART